MTNQDLIEQIKIIVDRESDPDFIKSMRLNIMANTTKETFDKAVYYYEQGVAVYQNEKNVSHALELLEKSLQIFKTPEAYFHKGYIYMHENNAYECLRAQTSSILLAGDDNPIPPSFRYRAIAFYEMMDESDSADKKEKNYILDFIIKDLERGIFVGDFDAQRMLNKMVTLRN